MKKYLLSLIVVVVAVAAMAFTNVEVPAKEAVAVQYQFTGNSMNNVYNTNLWVEVEGTGPSCGGENLPCVVSVESGTIGAWLNAREPEEILEDAQTLKD